MINDVKKKGTVQFAVHPESNAKKVLLAGTFNDWQPQRMTKKKDGTFVSNQQLAPGEYRYRFVIDGKWVPDNDNPARVPNPYGSVDSVVQISEQ